MLHRPQNIILITTQITTDTNLKEKIPRTFQHAPRKIAIDVALCFTDIHIEVKLVNNSFVNNHIRNKHKNIYDTVKQMQITTNIGGEIRPVGRKEIARRMERSRIQVAESIPHHITQSLDYTINLE